MPAESSGANFLLSEEIGMSAHEIAFLVYTVLLFSTFAVVLAWGAIQTTDLPTR